jgi:hypothetical protein
MAVKKKNPYGSLGPSPGTVAKINAASYPNYPAYNPYGSLGPSPQTVAKVNAAIAAPAAGAGAGVGPAPPAWQEPDWNALIGGDPEYASALSGITKQNQFDRGALQEAIRKAVVSGGYNLGTDDWIDSTTAEAAAANPLSTRAQIADQLRAGSAQSDAALAARGLLSSGQFTANRGNLQRGADTADASARDQLLNVIHGGQNDYLSAVSGRDAELRQLRATVAGRLAQNPGIFGPEAAAPAAPPPAAAPWTGISWGGKTGIKTKAQLVAALAPGVTYAAWAANHPDAARRLI